MKRLLTKNNSDPTPSQPTADSHFASPIGEEATLDPTPASHTAGRPLPQAERGQTELVQNIARNQRINREKLALAKQFRKVPTKAEKEAWQLLRGKKICGEKAAVRGEVSLGKLKGIKNEIF